MKKISFSIIAFFLMLCMGTNPLFSQDEEEAASDTTAVEDLEDEIDEAFLEEEDAEEEYVDSSPAFEGLTVGLNVGYPIITGEYYKDEGATGPSVGIVIGSPYGFPLGPFDIGVGGGIELGNAGGEKSAVGIFGTVNATVFVTAAGPLSVYGGIGIYNGLGTLGGISFDFSIPDTPIVIKAYTRATVFTGVEMPDDTTVASGWISIGVMVSYDVSTLF